MVWERGAPLSWKRAWWVRALGVAAGYAVVGGAYIVASSAYVSSLDLRPQEVTSVELAKGLGFVAVTGTLLFVVLAALFRRSDRLRRELVHRSTELAEARGESALYVAVGSIAHDMKNMLAALEGAHRELERRVEELSPEASETLEDMGEAIARLRGLAGDLLQRARDAHTPKRPETLDLAALAKGTVRFARASAAGSHCRLEVQAKGPCPVRGVRLDLEKALLNLLINAAEAAGDQGRVQVVVQGGAQPTLTVADDGPGVPEAMRQRIFEPFVTTKGDRGTGLGLAVVQQVVAEHGGEIELRASAQGGAEFHLSLPGADRELVQESFNKKYAT